MTLQFSKDGTAHGTVNYQGGTLTSLTGGLDGNLYLNIEGADSSDQGATYDHVYGQLTLAPNGHLVGTVHDDEVIPSENKVNPSTGTLTIDLSPV